MTTTSLCNSPHQNRQGNGDRLAPMQGEGIAIMVEDKLLRRRDSELIEEDVGKENTDLPNRNYGNLCLSIFVARLVGRVG